MYSKVALCKATLSPRVLPKCCSQISTFSCRDLRRRSSVSSHHVVVRTVSNVQVKRSISSIQATLQQIKRDKSYLIRTFAGYSASTVLAVVPTSDGPSPWLVLVAVVGLPTALWAYKCLMMVLFQRKIIYMGYVPPSARVEDLDDKITAHFPGILCEEIQLRGDDNINLRGILVTRRAAKIPDTVIIYLQGNAGNPLGRIPAFERLLLGHSFSPQSVSSLERTAVIAVAPRSYWKSSSRTPTEKGIILDYKSVVAYATKLFPNARIILYGHSLGGAAAVCLSAQTNHNEFPNVHGIILENPFASIPGMVQALYPQKWLPYHYLGRFAFDKWDALGAMQNAPSTSLLHRLAGRLMVILSKKDELVPNEMGESLFCVSETRPVADSASLRRMVVIDKALHEDAWQQRKWRTVIGDYVTEIQKLKS